MFGRIKRGVHPIPAGVRLSLGVQFFQLNAYGFQKILRPELTTAHLAKAARSLEFLQVREYIFFTSRVDLLLSYPALLIHTSNDLFDAIEYTFHPNPSQIWVVLRFDARGSYL